MAEGVVKADWYDYRRGWEMVQGEIIEEALMTIYVNGGELMTIMSTPGEWDYLGLGFLKNEGFIDDMDEVDHVYVTIAAVAWMCGFIMRLTPTGERF